MEAFKLVLPLALSLLAEITSISAEIGGREVRGEERADPWALCNEFANEKQFDSKVPSMQTSIGQ